MSEPDEVVVWDRSAHGLQPVEIIIWEPEAWEQGKRGGKLNPYAVGTNKHACFELGTGERRRELAFMADIETRRKRAG